MNPKHAAIVRSVIVVLFLALTLALHTVLSSAAGRWSNEAPAAALLPAPHPVPVASSPDAPSVVAVTRWSPPEVKIAPAPAPARR